MSDGIFCVLLPTDMKKLVFLSAVALLMLTACGHKTTGGENADTLSVDTVVTDSVATNLDSLKHTQEYILQRIDTIYKYKDNSRFCSQRYLTLDAEASQLSDELDELYIDSDHWIVGQDIDPQWHYRVEKIVAVSDSIALLSWWFTTSATRKWCSTCCMSEATGMWMISITSIKRMALLVR